MRPLAADERPTKRSRAIGGQVAIRSIGKMSACSRSKSGVILVKFSDQPRADSTCRVVFILVSLNALGANSMNHTLKASTDLAISAFHLSGLLRLTANQPLFFVSSQAKV